MSMSISGVSSSYAYAGTTQSAGRPPKPDANKMAEDLFSKLDTKGQGYLEKSDLASALSSSSTSSDSSSVDDLFNTLDSDSDGKITQSEMASGLKQLEQTLNDQFNQMRMSGTDGAQGMPPPPPPPQGQGGENDQGFTQDELSSMASELSSTDSKMSSLMQALSENFDQADSNGDGRVDRSEAMSYDKANNITGMGSSTSTSSTASDATTSTSDSSTSSASSLQVLRQIMQLMQAYNSDTSSTSSGGGLYAQA